MIVKVIGAGAGAMLANMAVESFVLQSTEGGPGFVKVEPGFGLDDIVRWVAVGVGAWAGMSLASKIGGG